MKIVIIDGQGGRMGSSVVSQLKALYPQLVLTAIGTNSIATASMIKAGADFGATGENPVVVACRDADLIVGPLGIVIADSLMGEITPTIASAIGSSSAHKLLIPVNKHCRHTIIGCAEMPLNEYLKIVAEKVGKMLE